MTVRAGVEGRVGASGGSGTLEVRIDVRALPVSARALERLLVRAARATLAARRVRLVALSVVVIGDRRMRVLNRDYHRDDRTTDVLAFPYEEGRRVDGEVVVCAPYAKREAKWRGLPWKTEVVLYAVHGILHLTGLDDGDAAGARQMRRAERSILAGLGLHLPASHLRELKHPLATRSSDARRGLSKVRRG